jgi:hypothetical protein
LLRCAVVTECTGARPTTDMYVAKNPKNTWRHTVLPVQGRTKIKVPCVAMKDVLKKHGAVDAVKLDIEGTEIAMLQKTTWPKRVKVLTFEWSFSHDASVDTFKGVIKYLRKGFTCNFPPSTLKRPEGMRRHDRDVVVHCFR